MCVCVCVCEFVERDRSEVSDSARKECERATMQSALCRRRNLKQPGARARRTGPTRKSTRLFLSPCRALLSPAGREGAGAAVATT